MANIEKCPFETTSFEPCLFHSDIWWLCLTKSEWASWIQALTGLLGVIVAIWVVWYQLRQNRRVESENNAQRVEAHVALIEYGAAGLHVILIEYKSSATPNLEIIRTCSEQLRQVKAALDRFQLETARSGQETQNLLAARDTAASALLSIPLGSKMLADLERDWHSLKSYSKMLADEARNIRKY